VRKRKSKATAIEVDDDRAGFGAVITRHPRESVGILMATLAVLTIFVNALYLQKGPHPAPIFATRPLLSPAPVFASTPVSAPRSRYAEPTMTTLAPVETPVRNRVQLIAEIQRELARRGYYDGSADGVWGAKTDSGARDFLQASGLRTNPEASEDLLRALRTVKSKELSAAAVGAVRIDPIANLIAPSRRVLSIQRALSDFGYGQIKPTGAYDPETRTAIEKFERDHKLPITGQISDRFVRELAAMTGRPLE
jgi:peptidoglycan hydrolase-like protein with peptidoglycan-binding domain